MHRQYNNLKTSMNTTSRRFTVDNLAILYLLTPLILFIWGWLQVWIALPLIAILCYSTIRYFHEPQNTTENTLKFYWKDLIPSALIFISALFLTGMTGNWVQHTDYFVRNDIFYDLTSKEWPPALEDGKYFIYYFQTWLPAALVGSLSNWMVAQWAYFIWSLIGVGLVLYYLYKSLNSTTFWISFALLAWGGLELVPCSLIAPWTQGLSISEAFGWNNHVAEPLVTFYPCFSIKSIVHCFIPIALICGMLMQKKILIKLAPLLSICALMYSPMGAIFMLPIVLYMYFQAHFTNVGQWRDTAIWEKLFFNAFSLCNISMYIILGLLIFPYYSIAESLGDWDLSEITSIKFHISLVVYFIFNTCIITWLIRLNNKDNLLWIVALVQLFCLLAAAVFNTDMAMKGTIVTQYFFFVLYCRAFMNAPTKHKVYYVLYLVGASVYFVHMTGALLSLVVGISIYLLLKFKQPYMYACLLLSTTALILSILLFPKLYSNTYSKLKGEQTKYNENVGIYQKDGGSWKWWWYRSFPDKSKTPSWFK